MMKFYARCFLLLSIALVLGGCASRYPVRVEKETRTYTQTKAPAPPLTPPKPAAPLTKKEPKPAEKPAAKSEPKPVAKIEKKAEKKSSKKHELIVVDAGHGGKDTGALSEKNKYEEKQLTLSTARIVRNYLEELGYETILTREYDTYVPLSSRAELANSLNAHLFVSIHYNFCDNVEVDGIEIFYYKDDKNPKASRLMASKKLGETVLSRIVKHTGAYGRGIKTANFAVVRETKMPAILIEAGFLSNPEERERIKDPQYLRYLAWGIAKGVDHYLETLSKTELSKK